MTAKAGRSDVYRAGKRRPQEKKHRELGERAGKSVTRVSKSLFCVAPWVLILKNRLPTSDHLSTQIILLIHCHKSDCVRG